MNHRFFNPAFCVNTLLLTFVLLMAGCACTKGSGKNNEPSAKEFTPSSWNGEFLQAISQAYEIFVKTDEMPLYVNVEGVDYSQAKYFSAACSIIVLIEHYPDSWQEQGDVDIPKYSSASSMSWNTFEQDEISLPALKWAMEKMDAYAAKVGAYPNYCCFGTRTWKDDRSGDSSVEYNYTSESEQYVGNLLSPRRLSAWRG